MILPNKHFVTPELCQTKLLGLDIGGCVYIKGDTDSSSLISLYSQYSELNSNPVYGKEKGPVTLRRHLPYRVNLIKLRVYDQVGRTALKKTELVFKINEEFIEITADGRRATSKDIKQYCRAWLCILTD